MALAAVWVWLMLSGSALVVWQNKEGDALICHYITALDLIELTYFYQESSPLGRTRCPITITAPSEEAYQ